MSRVIIAGSRDFTDYAELAEQLEILLISGYDIDEVVCGEARGADRLGCQWAEANNIPVKSFPANWEKYGMAAGPIRNKQMGQYADIAILFWDGKSRGTAHMRDYMLRQGKEVVIILINHNPLECPVCQG